MIENEAHHASAEASEIDAIEKMEDADRNEDSHNESPPSDIVAYNELRSCADLFRMADSGDLVVDPDFQRDFIWKGTDQTRFIDSLVKQLPVPSMCFAFDFKQNIWMVIDGLQRISTITRLLKGDDWKLASLDDIDPNLRGKNAATLKNATSGENKTLFSRVQNQALPVNIIRCDLSKRSHNEYIYTIFHRLNTGGMKLNNQEIRNCIYSGSLIGLIKKLDGTPDWRRINHMNREGNYRFIKQEIITRFFAFMEQRDRYKGSMSKFLNDYMFDNRNIGSENLDRKASLFSRVVEILSKRILTSEPPLRLPGTVLEAAMIGVASNITHCESLDDANLQEKFLTLRGHNSLSSEFLAEGLSKPDRVSDRLAAAIDIFSK